MGVSSFLQCVTEIPYADLQMIVKTFHPIINHAIPQQVETYVATADKKRLAKRGIALIGQNKV